MSSYYCHFCGGKIEIIGSPLGGSFTPLRLTCPCKKSSGFLGGIGEGRLGAHGVARRS
jgi:hypothetical protein